MFENFFIDPQNIPLDAVTGVYVPYLVFVSYVVACFGAFTGLTLAGGMAHARTAK